ncbi:DEP domain-containing protein 1A-like [Styela clava]|uniref:DEP domain-containing protein 1A-like n=1 Tax=Styela clava TaxID=7725 RepID=UPI0019393531|nr:DEP domain-containing protein 1A-like [Styela clava]XP_039253448.1 DEP domain-containing protein 1A-like [Styela clava]
MDTSPLTVKSPPRSSGVIRRSPCCQYKATMLWNELIQEFRNHIKCKTHRRNLRTHHNCFTGTAAVNVMFAVLKENKTFTVRVTRKQAAKLLQKFLDKHIIEDINGRWELEKFANNKRLFRFPRELRTPNETQMSSETLKRSSAIFMMIAGNRSLSPCQGIRILSPPLARRLRSRISNRTLGATFTTLGRQKTKESPHND